MSDAPTAGTRGNLSENVDDGLDRVIRALGGGDAGASLTGLDRELFEVLVASDALLETVDLDRVPGSVDLVSLRERIDLERLAEAIEERDPDIALDLSDLEESVDTRELLDSIDLVEFARAKRRLERELEDVVGEDGISVGDGESKAGADANQFVASLGREAKQTALRQAARRRAAAAQQAIVDGHAAMEERYEANRQRFADANDPKTGRNPTAVSLVSPRPLPDGVSTRVSSVPRAVRHSKTDPIPRVYSRRWASRRPRSRTR